MNTSKKTTNAAKIASVQIPGRKGKNSTPTSKSDLIRKLSTRFTTGEIKKKLEEVGLKIHYSEIYGAIERVPAV